MERFQESISSNPYFFNAPFSGVVVQPAAYTFIYRFMANKSAENPEGVLTKEVLKSFFGFTGPDDDMVHNPGWERIPENWYKRALGDEYTIPFYALDLNAAALQHPQFLDIGGNVSFPFASIPLLPLPEKRNEERPKKETTLTFLPHLLDGHAKLLHSHRPSKPHRRPLQHPSPPRRQQSCMLRLPSRRPVCSRSAQGPCQGSCWRTWPAGRRADKRAKRARVSTVGRGGLGWGQPGTVSGVDRIEG